MKKPYRSIYFNDERKWKSTSHLDDVLQVGKQKAIGYIFSTKDGKSKCSLDDIDRCEIALVNDEKLVRRTESDYCVALYAGDIKMINDIVNEKNLLLDTFGWKRDPVWIFDKISKDENMDHQKYFDLYHIVCDLFNSWCLFCEDKIWEGKEVFSVNPYDPDLDIDCC